MAKTIYDVAKEAGVSTTTVSRVINNSGYVNQKTREKVIKAMEGYHPNSAAREIVTKRTQTIGLIVPHSPEYFFTNISYSRVMVGISTIAKTYDYKLLIDIDKECTDYTALFYQKKVDGIILMGIRENDRHIQKIVDEQLPFVLIGDFLDTSLQFTKVEVDDFSLSLETTNYLVKMGHTKIAIITGPQTFASSCNRLRGYKQGLENAKIKFNENYVLGNDKVSEKTGYLSAKSLMMQDDPPTAIIAFNDTMAIGVYDAIQELGFSIPSDISVTGFDDIDVSKYLDPPLTTAWQPSYQKGMEAARLLINKINSDGGFEKQGDLTMLLPGHLIIRDSVAKPRDSLRSK